MSESDLLRDLNGDTYTMPHVGRRVISSAEQVSKKPAPKEVKIPQKEDNNILNNNLIRKPAPKTKPLVATNEEIIEPKVEEPAIAKTKPAPKTAVVKKPVAEPTVIVGYKYVYLCHQKGAKAPEIAMKLGCTNNVPEAKTELESGNVTDLKCPLIIECARMDGQHVMETLRRKLAPKHVHRDWYKLSKAEVEKLGDEYKGKGYELSTEGRAKLTKVEIKKLNV